MAGIKEFKNISRDKLNGIRRDLKKTGLMIPAGDDVYIEGPFGVRLQATFNEAKETLKLAITEKPIFVTENQIWKVIENGAPALS